MKVECGVNKWMSPCIFNSRQKYIYREREREREMLEKGVYIGKNT